MELLVSYDDALIGRLGLDAERSLYTFRYDPTWLARETRFALSPKLPLTADFDGALAQQHSAQVRQFFDNLLPEGRALDEIAAASKVSKANLMALLRVAGRESAGALRIHSADEPAKPAQARYLSRVELHGRIAARPDEPFSVWDHKIRLSVAGYQDKLAVLAHQGHWFLVDGDTLASTHLLKPEPLARGLRGLTSNEFFCLRLARALRLPSAEVELVHVPDPVLVVTRFDRRVVHGDDDAGGDPPTLPPRLRVRRLHIVDGAQALGLSANYKYERPYGHGRDVAHVREGASYPRLFELLRRNSPNPARDRYHLLRWALFQVLIGNTDAHAKNLSFYVDSSGLTLAPAYDLVAALALDVGSRDLLETHFAMAVSDAFRAEDLNAEEWHDFAKRCGLSPRQVATELTRMSQRALEVLPTVVAQAEAAQADQPTVDRIVAHIEQECARQAAMAPGILDARRNALAR